MNIEVSLAYCTGEPPLEDLKLEVVPITHVMAREWREEACLGIPNTEFEAEFLEVGHVVEHLRCEPEDVRPLVRPHLRV